MLFDLRGRGRRNTVRVIYASLAILMGGGLVLFGVGSDTGIGLLNSSDGGRTEDVDDTLNQRVESLEKKVQASPRDAAAWADLARARFQVAGTGENYDQAQATYTEEGRALLEGVEAAWDKHLVLAGDKPNADVANVMVQAFGPAGLNELDKAVAAMEIVVEARPEAAGLYAQLAQLAYLAGQTRKGDLSSKKAISLADKDERQQLRSQLDSFKAQAAAQTATEQLPPAAEPPAEPGGSSGAGTSTAP